MSKALRVRTQQQVKAHASALDGSRSRVAAAAADDATPQDDTGTVGELWLYGVVGGWWRGFDAESVANALRELDVDTLYVRIHSPGGYASDGVAIANLFRNHRANVIVVVDGLAASAASVIAIAGNQIIMCPGSQLMLHDASTYGYGNAADLRRAADWIDGQSDNYAGVYAHRAGGTAASWRQVMTANDGDGTWYTAEAAVTAGLADEVGNVVAIGSPPVAPEDDIDDDEMWARAAHDLELLELCVHPAARAAWRGESPASASTRRAGTTKPPSASAVGSHHTEGGTAVAFSPEQITTMRSTLELDETADEMAIVAAVQAVVEENLEDRPATATTTTPALSEGQVVISEAELATLRAGAEAGSRAAAALHQRDRDALLDANKAKFPAELRASWAKQYDLDPAATAAALSAAPDMVPVGELGHSTDTTNTDATATVREDPAYKNWSV